MTSNLKFLAFAATVVMTCATTRSDPTPAASPAPAAGHRPALLAEPRLTAEEEQGLRAQLAECQKFTGLSHYAAEIRALEERRGTVGGSPRFRECEGVLLELAQLDITLEKKDPRGRDCMRTITEGNARDIRNLAGCIERTMEDVDWSARQIQALVRQEELRQAHDACLTWLNRSEHFDLVCQEIEDTLQRQGRGK